jgi:mannose-6-phosphate isomerase-like protein (cupin superfamily)
MDISDYLVPPSHIFNTLIKEDDRYIVTETEFGRFTLSRTILRPEKATSGHEHASQEEIYFFKEGRGEMTLNEEVFSVCEGDVVLVEPGVFHKVNNTNDTWDLVFDAIFIGERADEAK